MADAEDLKSFGGEPPCGFKSHRRYSSDSTHGLGSGDQFWDRLAVGDDRDRSPKPVGDRDPLVVDPEMSVDGCQEIVRTDAAIDHVLAPAIRRADDLTARDPAPRPDHGIRPVPVIPAGLCRPGRRARAAAAARHVGDAGRAPEFARDDDQDPFLESSVVDILDQGGDRLVEIRGAEFEGVEDVVIDGIIIPIRDPAAERAIEGRGDEVAPASTSRRAMRHCWPQACRP